MIEEGERNLRQVRCNNHEMQQTTVIRISDRNYEELRTRAFIERKPIRQLADELLENVLKQQ